MCGRMVLHHTPNEVAQRFEVQEVLFEFPPRYNIGPMQPVAVVTQNAFGDGKRVLEPMQWGLVPSWAKDASIASKLIHARTETVAEKPSYRTALARRRCLIVSDGFYEWLGKGKDAQPMHIRFKDGRLFAFAGLWEEWLSPDGSPLRSCTMLTGAPNPLLSTLHHRMAIMFSPEQEEMWLNPRLTLKEALDLLQMYPDDKLEAYPVDKRVGKIGFEDPVSIQPLTDEEPEPEMGGQLGLF